MPNLGAGVDQHINLAAIPTWVFTPAAGLSGNTLRLLNEGSNVLYIGQSAVTPSTGFPLLPGNRGVELQNVNSSIYACSGVVAGTAAATVSTTLASMTAGTTGVTVASGGMANIPVGTTFLIGTGTGQEALVVATSASTTAITTTTATLFEHGPADVIKSCTTVIGQLRATAGVL
jgi:hypothetical protein